MTFGRGDINTHRERVMQKLRMLGDFKPWRHDRAMRTVEWFMGRGENCGGNRVRFYVEGGKVRFGAYRV